MDKKQESLFCRLAGSTCAKYETAAEVAECLVQFTEEELELNRCSYSADLQ